jgi:hypothetical protein
MRRFVRSNLEKLSGIWTMTEAHLAPLPGIAAQLKRLREEIETIEAKERTIFATDGAEKKRRSRVEALHDARVAVDDNEHPGHRVGINVALGDVA